MVYFCQPVFMEVIYHCKYWKSTWRITLILAGEGRDRGETGAWGGEWGRGRAVGSELQHLPGHEQDSTKNKSIKTEWYTRAIKQAMCCSPLPINNKPFWNISLLFMALAIDCCKVMVMRQIDVFPNIWWIIVMPKRGICTAINQSHDTAFWWRPYDASTFIVLLWMTMTIWSFESLI